MASVFTVDGKAVMVDGKALTLGDSVVDTADATATAEDISVGVSAYVNGVKVEGSQPLLSSVRPKSYWVKLSASGWASDSLQQIISIPDVVANEAQQFIQPVPVEENLEQYQECNVSMSQQSDGSVTFICETAPSVDLYVWVVVHDVTYVPLRNIIHFELNDGSSVGIDSAYLTTYEAEEGMTWGEYIISPYNTAGFSADDSGASICIGGYSLAASTNGVTADTPTTNQLIINGASYRMAN